MRLRSLLAFVVIFSSVAVAWQQPATVDYVIVPRLFTANPQDRGPRLGVPRLPQGQSHRL